MVDKIFHLINYLIIYYFFKKFQNTGLNCNFEYSEESDKELYHK